MIKLINSAMMPAPGNYRHERISQWQFSQYMRHPHESFIGYPSTAAFIERISGVKVAVSRAQATVSDGDVLLICKLRYRVQNPGDKSKFTPSDDDYEFFVCTYRA